MESPGRVNGIELERRFETLLGDLFRQRHLKRDKEVCPRGNSTSTVDLGIASFCALLVFLLVKCIA